MDGVQALNDEVLEALVEDVVFTVCNYSVLMSAYSIITSVLHKEL